MKKITMFKMASCPHCKQANRWMEKLFKLNPRYSEIPLTIIDEVETPEIAAKYDYHYVPTYYLDSEKAHEGAASLEIIRNIFDKALEE